MKETKEFNNITGANFHRSSFNEVSDNAIERNLMELPALSHTKMEQLLYELMFAETRKAMTKSGMFSTSYLMAQTGIYNYSSLRRAQVGLVNKMSIERQKPIGSAKSSAAIYVIYSPTEILARRREAGFNPYPKEITDGEPENSTAWVTERLVTQHNLSRRQAQVTLKCAEGLSNAEIGAKLFIQQETVKFHLRNIFIKFGVRRRTELIAYLFRHGLTDQPLKS